MSESPSNSEGAMIRQAVAGSRSALDCLLALHGPRLAGRISSLVPSDLKTVLSVEDVLQEAFVEVCRSIGHCRADERQAFFYWVLSIVEHQATDLVRAARAAKRGGGWLAMDADSTCMHNVLLAAASREGSPSATAARHEALAALRSAMEVLPAHYREAIQLRYFEDLAVSHIAARMGRTEPAVHLLCYRGLRRLAAELGPALRFLSWGG